MKERFISISEQFYRFLSESLGYTHPVHPTQINMPIGLVMGALIFGILALFARRSTLRFSARHCLIVALLFTITSALTGIMDWQHYLGGVWIFPIRAKIGLGAILLLLLVWGLLISRRAERSGSLALVCFLAFCTSVALGYFGGEIVFGRRAPESKQGHRAGEIIFRNNCSMCHPYGANILFPDRPIINSPLLESFQHFLEWLRNPKPPMPSFPPGHISDEQAQTLYEYLSEIWTGHEHGEDATPHEQSPSGPAPSPSGRADEDHHPKSPRQLSISLITSHFELTV